MTDYKAPIDTIEFLLNDVIGQTQIDQQMVSAILNEAGKFAEQEFAPLNAPGDKQGSRLENGVVRTPDGFPETYQKFVDGGWNALPFSPDNGGGGLPWLISLAAQEMWQSANLAFTLCVLLNQAAIEVLDQHGSDQEKSKFLPNLMTGKWTGTMNLTEPHAGSDVGAIKTRAIKTRAIKGKDHYLIKGQKIYITYGDHDMAENIIHFVLARTEGAPDGIKGLSLFLIPKFMVNDDGSLGDRNDVTAISLEHKMGIHASPTAVMEYGAKDGAIGYLIGEECKGIQSMFLMMNNARISVGLEGVAIAERATQAALSYAAERVQGRIDGQDVTINQHPDVKRMLLEMQSLTLAARALTLQTAAWMDDGQNDLANLLIPVVKAWCTDIGCHVASLGIQVHGGMGYIEETGAAQHLRDARITPIYEGTNGIQAKDLVFRKLALNGGETVKSFFSQMAEVSGNDSGFAEALNVLQTTTTGLGSILHESPDKAAAAATPYLELFGVVAGGWMMERCLQKLDAQSPEHEKMYKLIMYYRRAILPKYKFLSSIIPNIHEAVLD